MRNADIRHVTLTLNLEGDLAADCSSAELNRAVRRMLRSSAARTALAAEMARALADSEATR